MNRTDLSFDSGGTSLAAWLYLPEGDADGAAPRPCVVLAHGFGATRAGRLWAYAERFADAGYAALVFDYRYFGDSAGEPRQLIDIAAQHDDWRAAIAVARSLPEVDADQVVVWGSSFSGGHVALMAAEDGRLAAAISQNPFMDGLATLRVLGFAHNVRLTIAALRDIGRSLRGSEPYRIPIVGPPGTTGAMCSPDSLPGYSAMFEPGDRWRNEFAARVGLRVGTYRPARRAPAIKCPWLVQVAEDDVINPPRPALLAAARAPRGQARHYPGGHFDIYVGDGFERAIANQIQFLHEVLTPAPALAGVRS